MATSARAIRAKRTERSHKRHTYGASLNLVSLMDIMTLLVFFLLVDTSNVEMVPKAAELQLPESFAEQKPEETVVIVIGEEDLIVQGAPVARIADVMAQDGNDIAPLRQALQSQSDRILRRDARDEIAGREVTILGDKEIPYSLLKKVMATCTASNYGQISLAVLQKNALQAANE